MGRFTKLLGSKHHLKDLEAARERYRSALERDPDAWAYMACEQDADTCETCLHAAGLLREAKLSDPRLVVMRDGHPGCTSPHGCRCKIVIVEGEGPRRPGGSAPA